MKLNLLKGNIPLVFTYWLFGVLPGIIYRLIGMIIDKYYLKISLIPHSQWFFYLYLLFPFLYFPFIYVAIWNSSNHYTKNKLWPILAKIAVILGSLFLLAGIMQIINQFIHRNDVTYKISQEVNLINKSLPIKMDDETEIEKVSFNNKNLLTYVYRLMQKDKSDISLNVFSFLIKPKLIHLVCSNQALKDYLSKGINVSYHIIDRKGMDVYDYTVTSGDCNYP
ncbi:hypothetical protein [Legionella maioricensis]|uniref:Uncharacterized protein n=1 Tax=Legionella maioricensis TaxID=2896528 RepID=A0A9X2D199_9GAMM|nr:hypothetical protein [Legionella maioricensis]MCL9684556.1 hypothetical protein [Legionella maioricensis]MCL9687850.1 hypothetical protein [Legionella maioricensis]